MKIKLSNLNEEILRVGLFLIFIRKIKLDLIYNNVIVAAMEKSIKIWDVEMAIVKWKIDLREKYFFKLICWNFFRINSFNVIGNNNLSNFFIVVRSINGKIDILYLKEKQKVENSFIDTSYIMYFFSKT